MSGTSAIHTVRRRIRFADSDPAGIVFYVEYFRMFNDLFESWIDEALGLDFAAEFLSEGRMFPLVHVEVDFNRPRRMGQMLDLGLVLTRLGRSSIDYDILGAEGGTEILRGRFVTCMASKATGRSIPIPDYIRAPMTEYLEACRQARGPAAAGGDGR